MPSTIIGNPLASGPQPLMSGNPYSGQIRPVGGIQLTLDRSASGSVYIGLSGGMTTNSGGMLLSGVSFTDGMQLGPGQSMFVPRIATGASGSIGLYVGHDAACSGQARLFFEIF